MIIINFGFKNAIIMITINIISPTLHPSWKETISSQTFQIMLKIP